MDELDAVVVWVDSLEDKEALVASNPGKFFTRSHYDGHPVVLVRLEAVDVDEVTELIGDSWRLRTCLKRGYERVFSNLGLCLPGGGIRRI